MASIKATFWTFAKRENSTKAPTDGGTEINIALKDATNLLSPVIELHYSEAFRFNYCYIDFTGRYYFVTSFDSIAKDTYIANLECDVLATWISSVRGQSVYASMCSYGYDVNIDDTRVVPLNDVEVSWNSPFFLTGLTGNIPYQFLSVITNDGLLSGVDIFYAGASSGRIGDFVQSLSDVAFWTDLAMRISGVNAFDSLNELYYLPFIPEFCHATDNAHWAGVFTKEIRGFSCIADPRVKEHNDGDIEIRKPTNRDFRYSEKYVKYYLQLPYIGVISVPTDLCRKASRLTFDYAMDCISGTLCIAPRVAGVLLGVFSTNLKSSIGIARQHKQGSAIMQSAVNSVTGGALSGAMLGGVSGALAGAAGGALLAGAQSVLTMPSFDRVGSNSGSLAPLGLTNEQGVQLYCVEADSDIDPATLNAIAGRPTERVVAIANGFIQARNASVSFAGSPEEIRQFNNLLNGGIYVE